MTRTLELHHTQEEIISLLEELQYSYAIGTERKETLIKALECIRDNQVDRFISIIATELT